MVLLVVDVTDSTLRNGRHGGFSGRDHILAYGDRALAAVPGGPELYARVDLVDGDDGRPRLMEPELVEPNLFLATVHPGSVSAVVDAMLKAAAPLTRPRRPAATVPR